MCVSVCGESVQRLRFFPVGFNASTGITIFGVNLMYHVKPAEIFPSAIKEPIAQPNSSKLVVSRRTLLLLLHHLLLTIYGRGYREEPRTRKHENFTSITTTKKRYTDTYIEARSERRNTTNVFGFNS